MWQRSRPWTDPVPGTNQVFCGEVGDVRPAWRVLENRGTAMGALVRRGPRRPLGSGSWLHRGTSSNVDRRPFSL